MSGRRRGGTARSGRRDSTLRKSTLVGATVLIISAVATAAFFTLRGYGAGSSAAATRMFTVNSTPSGATVMLGSVELGRTPYYADNPLAPGATGEVTLFLRSYKPWKTTASGSEDVRIDAQLKRVRGRSVDASAPASPPQAAPHAASTPPAPGPTSAPGPVTTAPDRRTRALSAEEVAPLLGEALDQVRLRDDGGIRRPLVPAGAGGR